jgi:stalled ribosome rescue protein Dom34
VSLDQSIVWIDEKEARILRVEEGLYHKATIHPPESATRASVEHASFESDGGYFNQVARALDWADEILIVGPSSTKSEFLKYMHKNDHAIDPRILGVESIEEPSDKELIGFADLYFRAGGPARSGNGAKRKSS